MDDGGGPVPDPGRGDLPIALAMLTAAVLAMPTTLPEQCDHGHRSTVAKNRIHRLLHNTQPQPRRGRVAHYALCVSTRAKRRRLRAYAASQNAWRLGYPQVWAIKFRRLPPGGQQWAYSTGACESGNNPATSTGNGFYGAFQWVPSTWASAGGDRPVTSASWHHQATLAWLWHLGHPSGQWPVCGE